ncbi:MAG: MFS transporter [Actinomycetota bacterium]
MLFNRPHAIHQLARDDVGRDLARLGGLEGFSRSLTVTVLPLAVLDALGSKAAVSNAYFAGSLLAFCATLNVGRFEQLIARRWVLTIAMTGMVLANVLVVSVDGPSLALAVSLVNTSSAIFAVLIALFIMEYIGKRELARNESRRMIHNGVAWGIGPLISVWLYTDVAEWTPFALAGLCSCATLAYFWWLRIGPNAALSAPREPAPSPLANIPRYFRQRYLRIAYVITLVRGTFWASLFVYAPLYILEAELPSMLTGGLVSIVAALLLASPLTLRAVDMTSTKTVMIAGFVLIAASLLALAAIGPAEPVGVVFWVTGALGASWLDVLGNIPFMRTVRPRERTAMATVFSSWRETSAVVAPGLGALVLVVAPFWVYYVVVAAMALATAMYVTYLPARI